MLLLVTIYLALVGTSAQGRLYELTLAQRVSDPAFILMLLVAVLFAWSLISPHSQPIQVIFRRVVKPRLAEATELEDARPPRFAQGVGLIVVSIGLLLHLLSVPWALVIAGAAAFVAAALNATIGWCLGCEIYLLLVRVGLLRSHARTLNS